MVFVNLVKKKNEDYVEFHDRFGKNIGQPMKLENWIKSQESRYDPIYLRRFLEKNKKFWW